MGQARKKAGRAKRKSGREGGPAMHYVLSDIHGNTRRFDSVMAQIDLRPEDTLYVLGDVIDRYPDGGRILRRLMGMPNVRMLLGNHEYMMLDALYDGWSEKPAPFSHWTQEQRLYLWYENGGETTHRYLKHLRRSLRQEIFAYLDSLPVNIPVTVGGRRYLLVHGGQAALFAQGAKDAAEYRDEREFSVWMRYEWWDAGPEDRTVIFGHTPTRYYQRRTPMSIWKGERLIGIDCGAGWPQGRLACLRLEDMAEFYSTDG